jgi:hypothetical protein
VRPTIESSVATDHTGTPLPRLGHPERPGHKDVPRLWSPLSSRVAALRVPVYISSDTRCVPTNASGPRIERTPPRPTGKAGALRHLRDRVGPTTTNAAPDPSATRARPKRNEITRFHTSTSGNIPQQRCRASSTARSSKDAATRVTPTPRRKAARKAKPRTAFGSPVTSMATTTRPAEGPCRAAFPTSPTTTTGQLPGRAASRVADLVAMPHRPDLRPRPRTISASPLSFRNRSAGVPPTRCGS